MIPKISFPLESLRLTPLYKNETELEKLRQASGARAPLSKVSAAYHDLYFPEPPENRPYTFASIVLSLDGKMAFPDNPKGPVVAQANRLNPQGALTDFWVLNLLTAHADGIITGAKILQVEPDSIFACQDEDLLAERKTILGKNPEVPLNVIVSFDGTDVPFEHIIFSMPEVRTLIATSQAGGQYLQEKYGAEVSLIGPYFSPAEVDPSSLSAQFQEKLIPCNKVVLMTGGKEPDAPLLMRCLRAAGIKHLLIESPTYMWLMMEQGLLNEFFVNYSPLYIGGPITPGYGLSFSEASHPHARFLVIALHNNSFLFTRQQLLYNAALNA
ncbi:MAG: dihydrofolate reductase family protein [Anaerolineaceae bacterium]|nr:dihydrofolate reductase family protein [Anaerolineaceae bacterium]